MAGNRCLVLGGGGFLGSHIAERLVNDGYPTRVFDCISGGGRNLAGIRDRVEIVEGDFGDQAGLFRALDGVDFVFHYLGTSLPATSNVNITGDIESNLVATVRLLEGCVAQGVRKVVFASSGGTVYGVPIQVPIPESHPTNPICSYGITKLAVEKYLLLFQRLHGLECLILRYANPYGERQNPQGQQGAVSVFLSKALQGEMVEIWGDGEVVRDFVYVHDAVDATMAAFSAPGVPQVLNVGSGAGVSINGLLGSIGQVSGRRPDVLYKPGRPVDVPSNVLDISCITRATGWNPSISLEAGLERTRRWMLDSCVNGILI